MTLLLRFPGPNFFFDHYLIIYSLQDLEADTDAIMGEEPSNVGSTSAKTGSASADAKTGNDSVRSSSSQSTQKSKEQSGHQTSSSINPSTNEVGTVKKESGPNSVQLDDSSSAGGI